MPASAPRARWIREFAQGSAGMRELLGGKGANLAEMTRVLAPGLVPAGFTVTTEACVEYMAAAGELPQGLEDELEVALRRLEEQAGRRLGDRDDPLLVSVRSGARESMPGMLDTVLNVGLDDEAVEGLARATENRRFAWDSYRRFVQMFGTVCRGVPSAAFEEVIEARKRDAGVRADTELDADDLAAVTVEFKRIVERESQKPLPQRAGAQLIEAVRAVFDSWTGERAVSYRRINGIPDDWGTAVTVQEMVFGNKGETSCSGVAFSRHELSGEPTPSGDFLQNAQGEDVVSGARTPLPLGEMESLLPDAHGRLLDVLRELEQHYADMQDVEFTVEEGRLYILQTRNAKRPAQAAVRFAVDAVAEGLLDRERAIATIDAARLDALLHPTFADDAEFEVLARGVAASPGAAKGAIVLTAEAAVAAAARGEEAILVRPFTDADDVAGFHAARGIITAEGGKASHAALVARGMGRPCVAGVGEFEIDLEAGEIHVGEKVLRESDRLAIDGSAGIATTDDVALSEPGLSGEFETVLDWADEMRTLGIRANADTPEDARRAVEFGAQGIGLCRTEHMFMAPDRQPRMRRMIMAESEAERRAALDELLPLQQDDFTEIFEVMRGMPVVIRLLDPPLHEFLPTAEELARELERARHDGEEVETLERSLERVHQLTEVNPMLGTRGVRLAVVHPEIYEMQVRAIVRAGLAVATDHGAAPAIEIMVPLVAYAGELALTSTLIRRIAGEEDPGRQLALEVGTMIELPRACLTARSIAAGADFFSFGTNDLTQAAIGFSRDDAEAGFLPSYLERGLLARSPFESIDEEGVGRLIALATEGARAADPELELGVCGEHGGDPRSIAFFDSLGLDYVSCSPYRVPVARVAAAQAAVGGAERAAQADLEAV